MIDKGEVLDAIFEAVDEVNEQLPKEKRLEKIGNSVLFGESGKLDSLALVNLFIGIEQKIEEKFGRAIALYESVMSQEVKPFRDIQALNEFIHSLLEEESRD